MGTQVKIIQILTLTASFGVMPSVADASKVSNHTRISHAKELMGGVYKRSVVRHSEDLEDVSDFIEAMTAKFLPKTYAERAKTIGTAIIRESEKHGFDPIFVMAVIQNESSFNPEMRGGHGEIGLMQIRPSTAQWFAKTKTKALKYRGDKTLLDPVENIRFGVAYMAYLRDKFESHSRLYISAYNMGATKVRSLVNEEKIPKEYVQAVMKRYVAMYHAFAEENRDTATQIQVAYGKLIDMTRKIASN